MRKLISYEKQIQNSSRAHSIILSHSIKMFSSHTYLIGVEILAAAEWWKNSKFGNRQQKFKKFLIYSSLQVAIES